VPSKLNYNAAKSIIIYSARLTKTPNLLNAQTIH